MLGYTHPGCNAPHLTPLGSRQVVCVNGLLPSCDAYSYTGVGSDVDKVAEYRAFARMRRAFPQSYTSYEMGNFSRFLIKVSTA